MPRSLQSLAWCPPLSVVFKLNVDGSHIDSSNSSVCGAIIRDSNIGRFIIGFAVFLIMLEVSFWGLAT